MKTPLIFFFLNKRPQKREAKRKPEKAKQGQTKTEAGKKPKVTKTETTKMTLGLASNPYITKMQKKKKKKKGHESHT